MAVAVLSNRGFNDNPPAVEIVSLQLLKDSTLCAIRAAIGKPLQPLSAKCMHAEIEEAGEADTNNRIKLA